MRGPLFFPLIPLALWYAFHYARTGFVFGNPEFFRYNVEATMQPLRIVLASRVAPLASRGISQPIFPHAGGIACHVAAAAA